MATVSLLPDIKRAPKERTKINEGIPRHIHKPNIYTKLKSVNQSITLVIIFSLTQKICLSNC